MATTSVTPCAESSSLPLNPFLGVLYSFGMLLGREDFQVEQGHPLGKQRLHNAWLHGAGVVWGFEVRIDRPSREIRVLPGLALDGLGRELHLDQESCVDIAAWLEEHRNDAGMEIRTDAERPGVETFDAHVVVRYRACQSRPVPSLAEPCDGAGASGTSYSRIVETVSLEMRPGPAPDALAPPFHRVRLLFGLDTPLTDEGGVVTAEDQAVLDEGATVAALPASDRPAAFLTALHRFSVLDGLIWRPPTVTDGVSLFPEVEPGLVVLANVNGLEVARNGETVTVPGGEVDPLVRPQHLPSRTIQDLLAPPVVAENAAITEVVIGDSLVALTFSVDLEPATVVAGAFEVSQFDGSAWSDVPISAAPYDPAARRVDLQLGSALDAGATVRILARSASLPALLGTGGEPLAGSPQDFVIARKRGS